MRVRSRRLEHHGATGGERRGDLAGDLVERPVPGRDHAYDPGRLLHEQKVLVLLLELVVTQDLRSGGEVHEAGRGLGGLGEAAGCAHLR